jgi:hypothetical protein
VQVVRRRDDEEVDLADPLEELHFVPDDGGGDAVHIGMLELLHHLQARLQRRLVLFGAQENVDELYVRCRSWQNLENRSPFVAARRSAPMRSREAKKRTGSQRKSIRASYGYPMR